MHRTGIHIAAPAAVLGAALLLAVPLYSFATMSFLDWKCIAAAAGVAVAVLCARKANLAQGLAAAGPVCVPLALGLAVAAAETLLRGLPARTSAEPLSVLAPALIAVILAAGACRVEGDRRWIHSAVLASAALASALGLVQLGGGLASWFPAFPDYGQPMYSVFGNQNLLGGYAAMALALAAALWRRGALAGRIAAPLAALFGAAVFASDAQSAWLAAVLGLAAACIGPGVRRAAVVGPVAAVLGGVAAAAFLVPTETLTPLARIGESAGLRLWYWSGALHMAAEHPLFGAGLGAFRVESPWHLGAALRGPGGGAMQFNGVHVHHAHNDLLEWFAEAGLAGALLLGLALWRLPRRGAPECAALAALAVFAMLHPMAASAPHMLAGALLLACWLGRAAADPQTAPPEAQPSAWRVRLAHAGLIAVSVAALAGAVWMAGVQSHALRAAAEADARPAYARLDAAPLSPPDAAKFRGIQALEQGDWAAAAAAFERARALGLDSGALWRGIALARRGQGEHAGAAAAAREALWRFPRDTAAWAMLLAYAEPAERSEAEAEARRWLTASEWADTEDMAADLSAERPEVNGAL